ncbi:MAG: adenine phosphoribosyltransferase [Planctomycetota bacterium]
MSPKQSIDLTTYIRDIPDFPKPGILFKDITPLLAQPAAFQQTIDRFVDFYRGRSIEAVVAAEARGFIFAAPLAVALGVGFVPIRKPGKLPYRTHAFEYDLEYGSDKLEIHVDGVQPGQRVAVIDDLLATGGTMNACCQLLEQLGAVIDSCGFVVELTFLGGAKLLAPREIFPLVRY